MRTLKLRWFTNPAALAPVGRYLLATFVNRFREGMDDKLAFGHQVNDRGVMPRAYQTTHALADRG